ncbi:MAG: peroxiredoxin-like family protein [Sphaerochaetaceae bacterium]|nr:peroxiredoxin-like family protein [Sphaerochaetaceae bacterium]
MKHKETLKNILDEKRQAFNATADSERIRIYEEGITAVALSGVLERARHVGDRAEDFVLPNAAGKDVRLRDYLKKGPVVLTWYRGSWCPYCNLTLSRLQKELPAFKEEGANLIAVTPEKPDKSMTTVEQYNLEFEVLSDLQNSVAREYGLIFNLTDEVARIYEESFQFHQYYDHERKELPLAATYIIDTEGIIRYAFIDEDYRNRAEPAEILEELKKLRH